jgi:hypothetical protein
MVIRREAIRITPIPIIGLMATRIIGALTGARVTVAGIANGMEATEVTATGATPVGVMRALAVRAAMVAVAAVPSAAVEVVATAAVAAGTLAARLAGLAHTLGRPRPGTARLIRGGDEMKSEPARR